MVPVQSEQQLELFNREGQGSAKPRREAVGWFQVHLRHDQLMLLGIGSMIGLTVVFACGVERGKQLVRSERPLMAHESPEGRTGVATTNTPPVIPVVKEKPQEQSRPSPAKTAVPSKVASSGSSRYAIQVSTYSQPRLAKQELDRLQARGERAFLVTRNGRFAVYVGPFPSVAHASQKLTGLKARYQDCFVKTL